MRGSTDLRLLTCSHCYNSVSSTSVFIWVRAPLGLLMTTTIGCARSVRMFPLAVVSHSGVPVKTVRTCLTRLSVRNKRLNVWHFFFLFFQRFVPSKRHTTFLPVLPAPRFRFFSFAWRTLTIGLV